MRALLTIQARDPGFRPEGVLTLQTPLPIPMYGKLATREGSTRVCFPRCVRCRASPMPLRQLLPLGKMRGGIWPSLSTDGRSTAPTIRTRFCAT
jgi:hypothetical protein